MSDLTELFEKDPLELTRAEVDEIIADLRKKRAAFNMGNAKAGAVKQATPKALQGIEADELKKLMEGGGGLKI